MAAEISLVASSQESGYSSDDSDYNVDDFAAYLISSADHDKNPQFPENRLVRNNPLERVRVNWIRAGYPLTTSVISYDVYAVASKWQKVTNSLTFADVFAQRWLPVSWKDSKMETILGCAVTDKLEHAHARLAKDNKVDKSDAAREAYVKKHFAEDLADQVLIFHTITRMKKSTLSVTGKDALAKLERGDMTLASVHRDAAFEQRLRAYFGEDGRLAQTLFESKNQKSVMRSAIIAWSRVANAYFAVTLMSRICGAVLAYRSRAIPLYAAARHSFTREETEEYLVEALFPVPAYEPFSCGAFLRANDFLESYAL